MPLLPATAEDLGDFSATDIPNPVNSSTVTSSYRTLYTAVVAALLIAQQLYRLWPMTQATIRRLWVWFTALTASKLVLVGGRWFGRKCIFGVTRACRGLLRFLVTLVFGLLAVLLNVLRRSVTIVLFGSVIVICCIEIAMQCPQTMEVRL